MKYNKKQVVMEAIKLENTYESICNAVEFVFNIDTRSSVIGANTTVQTVKDNNGLNIPTLNGCLKVDFGDYIIKGINEECYSYKAEIFEKAYEKIKIGLLNQKCEILTMDKELLKDTIDKCMTLQNKSNEMYNEEVKLKNKIKKLQEYLNQKEEERLQEEKKQSEKILKDIESIDLKSVLLNMDMQIALETLNSMWGVLSFSEKYTPLDLRMAIYDNYYETHKK